ncbi:tripartite tricarboxylate transporter substrate binding protein [Variovorax sp. J22R115]|uniref:Bug family tripartite tricarboxylate transporter substrate binding protein n=1 Tax=Variovorax sp. J22R115 TaxID=3053509 RepID=UPI0025770C7D|nr:tripartite tricarboxylate transporter substrate-binding protein [Variovorax sp. J22R115]MDM0050568.1 tripartite tricarboxylate transporter substrate-binding protein [Variovorax sp. J22R115]
MPSITRRAFASLLTALAFPVFAQSTYPSRPITIVVPFPAGGPTDASARTYAKALAERLGQPVVIDNRAGAAGTVGSAFVARASADGYTLLWGGTSTLAVAPGLYRNLKYDAQSFVPIGMALRGPLLLAASPASGLGTLAEVRQKAKQQNVTVGTAGTGSIGHLATELYSEVAQVKLTHVPYRGGSPAITDAIGGQVDLVFDTAAALYPFVKSGKLRAIAVTGVRPYAPLPDTPTMQATVGSGYEAYSWFGLVAPRDTPEAVLRKLRTTMYQVIQSAEIRALLNEQGVEPGVADADAFGKVIATDASKWSKIIQRANVTAE